MITENTTRLSCYADLSQGVERERDGGIQHSVTEQEIIRMALQFGIAQGARYGIGGWLLVQWV